MRPAHGLIAILLAVSSSCSGPFIRSQSPEATDEASRTKLVGDLAVSFGLHPVKVEGVALVTNLPGTGSDPDPSSARDELVSEMKSNGVVNANQVLSSTSTSLVLVRGFLRPGIQKGDRFDIEVRVPSRSGTTSLQGGWLMQTRLQELAVLQGSVREGSLVALAQGALLVDPSAGKDNSVAAGRARVLGGGVALKSRPLALVLKPDHRSVAASAHVGSAVNRRFHTFQVGLKQGVANPKDDQHVELIVHPRYKDNVERYMQVVRAIPIRESAAQQVARLGVLERQLLDPITSAAAALRLEAIGKEAIPVLLKGTKSPDQEVKFYAAEGLAYLDSSEAAAPLAEAARDVPAFRAYALAALSAMDDFAASEALRGLLDLPSNETRYGAFRALWAMNPKDALVRGEMLGDQFSVHTIDSMGPPLVHVTRSYRPEVVFFGQDQRIVTPFVLEAGKDIILTGKDDRVTVSRFVANEPDQKRVVSTRIDECIRAIVELGGTYPDVVAVLQQAKSKDVLASRLAMDAVPSGGRSYDRGSSESSEDAEADPEEGPARDKGRGVIVANPLPGLFDSGRKTFDKASDEGADSSPPPAKPAKKAHADRSWLGRMK
ncbi:MAG: flagellar basal body P-ring protein FlgI [Planctomycetia bacterium]|nr:flagellar basal body P-ring protein FlgI [Planctomycetia bacterium]